MNIKVFLADDHRMMRDGLKTMLQKEPGVVIVGEAAEGQATVAQVAKAAPNVVIMDVAMPGLNGIEATRKITKASPHTRVIALSGHADRHFVQEMLKAGASSYVLKHRAYEELVKAIRETMAGHNYLSPEVTQGIVDTYVRTAPTSPTAPAFATLSDREREVLQLLAEGQSTKEMAGALSVSVKTIETHRHNIMEKLRIYTVAQLTKYAIREGVTTVDG